MTQTSYVWDGIVTGDHGPYDKTYFQRLFNQTIAGNYEETYYAVPEPVVYVVPDYLNKLEVLYAGTSVSAVVVDTGAALVNGYIYENTSKKVLTVDRPLAYDRIDRVVLELNVNNQTIRLKVVKGTEAADPVAPALTQTAVIWQVDLAQYYVDASLTYIPDSYIYDKRIFIKTKELTYPYASRNLLKNSEFMAFSGAQSVGVTDAPEGWDIIGVPTRLEHYTNYYGSRGRGVYVVGGGIGQTFNIDPACKHFTIKGVVRRTTGVTNTVSAVYILSNSVTSAQRSKTTTPKTGNYNDILIHIDIDDDEEYDRLQFYVSTDNGVAIFQFIIVEGYHPGPYREFHEVIPFRVGVTDAAWTATAKSSGTTTITLNGAGSFGDVILPGTKFIMVRLRARDSGSLAGVTAALAVEGQAAPLNTTYLNMVCGGIANDYWRECQALVPVNQCLWNSLTETTQFRLIVTATGAATLDATVEIIGIII